MTRARDSSPKSADSRGSRSSATRRDFVSGQLSVRDRPKQWSQWRPQSAQARLGSHAAEQPVAGQLRNVTVRRNGTKWFASIQTRGNDTVALLRCRAHLGPRLRAHCVRCRVGRRDVRAIEGVREAAKEAEVRADDAPSTSSRVEARSSDQRFTHSPTPTLDKSSPRLKSPAAMPSASPMPAETWLASS